MSQRPRARDRTAPAADLSTAERVLLFCVASATEWERAGVTGATVTAMIVRGLVERDTANKLTLTVQGRAALKALIGL
jgi:hypothetical protein